MFSRTSIVLLLLLGCSIQNALSQSSTTTGLTSESSSTESTSTTVAPSTNPPPFTCTTHNGFSLDLQAISGYWYEVARYPDIDNTQCLNYSIPSSTDADDRIDVKLEYVDTADGKWEPTKDSGLFPWDDNTKNGIFNYAIGGTTQMPVTFKVVSTDNTTYTFLCGYMGIAPVPLFKVLTRERELSMDQKSLIQKKFNDFGQTTTLVWVEQSEQKCNSAMRASGGVLLALVLAMLIRQ